MRAPQAAVDRHEPSDSFSKIPPEAKPVIIMVSGLPGTGKSFFSRKLAERLPFVILESDDIRKKLFPEPTYSPAESARLFRFIRQQMDELLRKGTPVILDATNLTEKHRKSVYRIAERNGAKLIIVFVDAPPELVRKRLKSRAQQPNIYDKSDADWAVYQKMKPTAEKISRRHFTVNTARDITPVIDKIISEINR